MMFDSLGVWGQMFSVIFFLLLTIAALTSSISMLECPVALVSERWRTGRNKTAWALGGMIALLSAFVIYHFTTLFGLVVTVSTQYLQPLAALLFCLFGGWVWHRQAKLGELQQGFPDLSQHWFGRVWPDYVKYVCPFLVAVILWVSL
jgi:NSS family neurotransmitter:Na+ symporter